MFFKSERRLKSRIETLESALKSMTQDRDLHASKLSDASRLKDQEIKAIRVDHELEIKKKQFEVDYFETGEIKKLREALTSAEKELAVANTKLELMSKVTDVNADVLDVKDLVTKLIEKMPTININSIIAGLSGKETTKE